METLLCMGPGDVQGEPLEIDAEIGDFITLAYALDGTGRRLVLEAVLSRMKGRAKSMYAGAIACAEALGPVRFDHFAKRGETSWWGYQYERGEPVGRPVRAPLVRILATEEGQTGNTYDNVKVMLTDGRIADEVQGLRVFDGAVFLPDSGEIRPSTAGAASKDGGRETCVIADEVHLYTLPELRSMYKTVSRNLTKRRAAQPWLLATTTMHDPAEPSIGRDLHGRAVEIHEGRARNRSGLLYDHREGPRVADPTDDAELAAALEMAAGPAKVWMDIVGMVAEARKPATEWPEVERYYLNRPAQGEGAAFDLQKWETLADLGAVVADRETITLGFDGSRFNDATALVGCHVATGHLFLIQCWEHPPNDEPWEVPEAEVDAAVAQAFDRWDVWRMYCDPPYWESAVDRWIGRWGKERVVQWYTARDKAMAHAVRAFNNGIKSGAFSHDGSALLARHVGNCRRRRAAAKDDDGRWLWTIAKQSENRKIDAAVTAILAWEARGDAVAAGAMQPKRSKVMGTR